MYATYVARYVPYLAAYVANAIIIISHTYVRMFTHMCFVSTYM